MTTILGINVFREIWLDYNETVIYNELRENMTGL